MPFLQGGSEAKDSSTAKWRLVLKNALARRILPEQLKAPLEQLKCQYALPGQQIANVLMSFRAQDGRSEDPLLFQYAKLLLQVSYIGAADLLVALRERGNDSNDSNVHGLPTCEERVFTILAELQLTGGLANEPMELCRVTFAIAGWLHLASQQESAKQVEAVGLHTPDAFTFGKYEALATLALSVFGQPTFRGVAKAKWWRQRRAALVLEMQNFDMTVLQWMHSNFRGRLQALTNIPPFVETDENGRPILTQQQILEGILQEGDIAPTRSRAGLFIWLDACLCGRPMTDDLAMLSFLWTRYSANNQALSIDLVQASFDVLTNAIIRHIDAHELKCVRSFICNKLPSLLAIMSSAGVGQANMEVCLQAAFVSIAMDPIAPMEAGSSEATDVLRKTRLDFLQACSLHGFATEATIGSILQEPPITLPKMMKYAKEGLLAQCNANLSRLEGLVGELGGMQGNAGAIAGCVVDLVNALCNNKDTMSLKTACNILIKRIKDMDIVLQYTQPTNLLMPLCVLLKDWTHDQDQAEFTPAYEEFASVLLFTLSLLHRYVLTASDVGLAGIDNVVFKILEQGSSGPSLSDLTEEQSTQLSKWLEGLFAVDEQGETSGIGDEVMRQCPPQAFYMLVPILFEQSVAACKAKALPMKTLKSGLELLLEPFLLPSLVGGLSWLTSHSWEDHDDADILLQVLDKLLRPSTSSADTQAMHRAVMRIVSAPLKQSLEDLIRKRPEKTAAQNMIATLRSSSDSSRSITATKDELEQWASLDENEASRSLRTTVRQLVSWAAGASSVPPRYTHRLFLAACSIDGPTSVLHSMALELKETPFNNLSTALDVCTSIILAPTSVQHNLRQDLIMLANDTQSLLALPAGLATALVRLNRSIDALLAAQQVDVPFALPQVPATTADQMTLQELGLADPTAGPDGTGQAAAPQLSDADLEAALGQPLNMTAAGVQDMSNAGGAGTMQLDQTHDFFADLDMGMGQQQQGQGQPQLSMTGGDMSAGGQQNQEEDIFAGLDIDMGMNDDFNFG